MERKLNTFVKDNVVLCKSCNTSVQAGPRWVIFCPICNWVEDGFEMPDSIMSCCHCDKPVFIEITSDERVVGRCHTENCGDCFSMQDLSLIKKPGAKTEEQKHTEYIESILDLMTINTISTLVDFIKKVFKANCHTFFKEKRKDGVVLLASIHSHFLLNQCGLNKYIVLRILKEGVSELYNCEDLKEYNTDFIKIQKPVKSFETVYDLLNFLKPFASVASFPPKEELMSIQPVDIDVCRKNWEDWYQLLMKFVQYGVFLEDCRDNGETTYLFCVTLPEKAMPKDITVRNEFNEDFHGSNYIFFYPDDEEGVWIENYKDIVDCLNKLYKTNPILI